MTKIFAWIGTESQATEILFHDEPESREQAETQLKTRLGMHKLPDSIIIKEEDE